MFPTEKTRSGNLSKSRFNTRIQSSICYFLQGKGMDDDGRYYITTGGEQRLMAILAVST